MFKQIKIRITISIFLAIVIGYLSFTYLEKLKETVEVVVAKEDIPRYTVLTEDKLTTSLVSKKDMEKIFPNATLHKDELIGAITRVDIKKNKPIENLPYYLVIDKERAMAQNYVGGADKAYFIPYEKRVIAVQVDKTGTLNDTLQNGDFVDVIFTSTDDSTGGLYSNMILQHVEIFDIPKVDMEEDGGLGQQKRNVLLLATPEECLILSAGNRNGILDLVLNPIQGEKDFREPVHVLSFVAEEPASKSEKLAKLENRIKVEELTKLTKGQMLENIEKEKEIETILRTVESSKLSEELKKVLAEILTKSSGGEKGESHK